MEAALALADPRESEEVLRRLRDSIAYASDRQLKPEMERRYPYFPEARDDTPETLHKLLTASSTWWTEQATAFVAHNTTASASDLLEHLKTTAADLPFMDAPEDRPGRYRVLRGRAELAEWIKVMITERIDVEDLDQAARRITLHPDALAALAADESGNAILRAAEAKRRNDGLKYLRSIVENHESSEFDIHRALEEHLWIFGGQYVGKADRRRFVAGQEVDIPLLRPDGSLCVVELKKANTQVVTHYGKAPVVTANVHRAIGQASNYLVGLDENRHDILTDHFVDTRRANAMVLIGHPKFEPRATEAEINEVLRIQNGHLNRIEVLTYKELLDAAERSLATGQTLKRNSTTSPSAIT